MSFTEKLPQIQEALRSMNCDGWLFYDFRQSNIFAYHILDIPETQMKSRRFLYFIPANGSPKKLCHRIEFGALDHLPGEKVLYSTWTELREGIRDMIGSSKAIAMEYSANNNIPYVSKVDAGTLELIRSFGVEVVTSADLITQFEATWSDEQIAENLELGKWFRKEIDYLFGYIADHIRSGTTITEYDVMEHIRSRFKEHNLFTDHGPNCSVNANIANPHYEPEADKCERIKEGDLVLIDFWAKPDKPKGTYVDITWMGYVGSEVPQRFADAFSIVAGARDAAIDIVKSAFAEGREIRGYEVDDAARNSITERGMGEYFIHRTGHSIGEEVHGNGTHIDNFETKDERLILPMTSFSIEPGVYIPGDFGIRSEVDIVIDASRNVIVTTEPRQTEINALLR